MEAKLAIKANELTTDFIDGLMKVFSKDAILNITVNYGMDVAPSAPTPARRGPKPKGTQTTSAKPQTTGAKRGRKPKVQQEEAVAPTPKKRGRKPKVAAE